MNDETNEHPESFGNGPLTDAQLEGMSLWDRDDKIFESPAIVRYLVLRAVAELRQLRSARNTRPQTIRLVWYQRYDSLWNAACSCHTTICGFPFSQRADAEAVHFEAARKVRESRAANNPFPACGPKLPEANPNFTDPFVFP